MGSVGGVGDRPTRVGADVLAVATLRLEVTVLSTVSPQMSSDLFVFYCVFVIFIIYNLCFVFFVYFVSSFSFHHPLALCEQQ